MERNVESKVSCRAFEVRHSKLGYPGLGCPLAICGHGVSWESWRTLWALHNLEVWLESPRQAPADWDGINPSHVLVPLIRKQAPRVRLAI